MITGNRMGEPLIDYLDGATHIILRCTSPKQCYHQKQMMTADLVALLPRARSVQDFKERLVCSKCGCRGCLMISPMLRR